MSNLKKRLFDYAAMIVISLPAVEIDLQQFTAIWESAPDATGYFLDVAMDENFESIVGDYLDKDVGPDTSFLVSGLETDQAYYYRLRAYNEYDTGAYSNTVVVPIYTGEAEFKVQSSKFKVEVFPNPFSEIVHIEYKIGNPSQIEIMVLNAVGEILAVLQDGYLPKGMHRLDWNAAGLPPRLYFGRVIAGKESANLKLIRQ